MRRVIRITCFVVSFAGPGLLHGGDLVVGFGSDKAIQTGDASTLETTAGPALGIVSAMSHDEAMRVFVAAGGLVHRLAPGGGAVTATFVPPHDVVAIANGEDGLFLAARDGTVTQLDPDTGSFVKSSSLGLTLNAMVADGGKLYAATANGQIWKAEESDLIWKLEATSVPQGIHSLAARGSNLLVGVDGHVFVYERDSGALIYGYNVPNDAATLALEGNDVVVGGNDGSLYRVDPGAGTVWVAQSFTEGGAPAPVTALTVVEPAPFASLEAKPTWISISSPSTSSLRLEVSDSIGSLPYLVLGSISGTTPGVTIAGRHVPLNVDPYFSLCVAGNPLLLGGAGGFSDLNAFSVYMADASFGLPIGTPPAVVGVVVVHAFVVFDPTLGAIRAVSNPIGIVLGP